VRRDLFLALLRECDVLVGNSSSGIIEAASFNSPVVNIGERQRGRERGANVVDVAFDSKAVRDAIHRAIARPKRRWVGKNIYGGGRTGAAIARVLANARLDDALAAKLISY
jgi:GDP/UDP-N,N'-diacetylbacillosamine 2-epimerase (hydrolysing)